MMYFMYSYLFFLVCMSRIFGLKVPAFVHKDTGAITINVKVFTEEPPDKEYKLLIHTYSPLTWVATSATTFRQVEEQGTRFETIRKMPWSYVFTTDNKPPALPIYHLKRMELAEQPVDFVTYGKENYQSKLDYHVYRQQHILFISQDKAKSTLDVPLTLGIVERMMQTVPDNQTLPLLQFSGVIGATPAWTYPINSLLCVLGNKEIISKKELGHILAIDIKKGGNSLLGIGNTLHPLKKKFVELPISHKRGTRAPFHKYWTFDGDFQIKFPENVPINEIIGKGVEMMIDTTTDSIIIPVSVFDNLIAADFKDKYENYQLLYDFFHLHLAKPCDQIINLLPSVSFRFQTFHHTGNSDPLIIAVESSLLIKNEIQDQSLCKTLLRPQADIDFDFWRIGLPFLYKAYVELMIVDDKAVVKLFDKK